ncbi:MAG: cyclic beta 1-2 glucan synthetase, partial [Lysobacter sp.]|nr:cyclic beta 1-2 glucan synthetase [Lysobacter sp.]
MKLRNAKKRAVELAARFGRVRGHGKFEGVEPPLRSELYSAEQMERHGRNLAGTHRLAPGRAPDRLLARLAANERVLVDVWDLLTAAVTQNRRITPAAEWLLDNFHLIEEQVRTAKRHLPKGYSRELPRLAHGPSAGLPRVYDLAFETISHGDGRVDAESLSRFVAAYQEVTPLALGELWAIPIMLRLALIENLRRVGSRVAAGTLERASADAWANLMMQAAEHDPKSLILLIADMARSEPPMVGPFVAELARRLQGRSAALALPLTWIEQRLSESALSIEQLVQSEGQEQAADQVSVGNTIGSLRVLGAIDWRDFVESMSLVERALREDPGATYGGMDFATRDRYRHVVEEIARASPLPEIDVATMAIGLAGESDRDAGGGGSPDERVAHVGYYLVGPGRGRLEQAVRMRVSPARAIRRLGVGLRLPLYLGAIAATSAGLAWVLSARAHDGGAGGEVLVALAAALLLAASHVAVGMVNWLATLLVKPHALPRMDFSRGIAPGSRTLVVVPTMLVDAPGIEGLLEALEVRFLANRDEHLHFGLATDFADAPEESVPGDGLLVRLAAGGIEALNAKYGRADESGGEPRAGDTFFLFHRPRRWNPQER